MEPREAEIAGPKRSIFHRTGIIVSGWTLVVLGVAGLFLPFLQGILFLSLGLSVLALEYPWARRWLEKLKRKFPQYTQQSK